MELQEKLNKIQQELKAPKNQFNKFGGYKYRSCEDILEAVKPLLDGAILLISDEMVQLGDRYYIKAEATITNEKDQIRVYGYAREPQIRKGMDESQITGASSSYARKYALNGLFCIEDTKDPDGTNKHEEEPVKKSAPKEKPASTSGTKFKKALSDGQRKKLWAMAKSKDVTDDESKEYIEWLMSLPEIETIEKDDGKTTFTMTGASYVFDNFDGLFESWIQTKLEA